MDKENPMVLGELKQVTAVCSGSGKLGFMHQPVKIVHCEGTVGSNRASKIYFSPIFYLLAFTQILPYFTFLSSNDADR